jgi:hypothetical protein
MLKSWNLGIVSPNLNSEGAIFDASESKSACERYFFNWITGFSATYAFLSFSGKISGQSNFSDLEDYSKNITEKIFLGPIWLIRLGCLGISVSLID